MQTQTDKATKIYWPDQFGTKQISGVKSSIKKYLVKLETTGSIFVDVVHIMIIYYAILLLLNYHICSSTDRRPTCTLDFLICLSVKKKHQMAMVTYSSSKITTQFFPKVTSCLHVGGIEPFSIITWKDLGFSNSTVSNHYNFCRTVWGWHVLKFAREIADFDSLQQCSVPFLLILRIPGTSTVELWEGKRLPGNNK